MKIKTKLIIIVGALLCILMTGAVVKMSATDKEYEKETLQPADFQVQILATGTVRSENEVEIKAPISGRIDKILVEEGQKVKANQILLYISSSERAALLDAARSRGEAEYQEWTKIYNSTPVIAPIAGTIIQRKFEPGQSFNQENAILVMSDRLTIKAKVDETDIGNVVVGQSAEIILDAYPQEKIKARVDQIAFNALTENGVTTYQVDVLPLNAPAFMRSGMTANVKIEMQNKKNVLSVPLAAIQNRGEQQVVTIEDLQNRGTTIEKVVKVGLSHGHRVEIIEGLQAGDVLMLKKFPFGEEK